MITIYGTEEILMHRRQIEKNVAEKLANWHDLRHILRRINKTIPPRYGNHLHKKENYRQLVTVR